MTFIPQSFLDHLTQQSLDKESLDEFITSCQTPLRKSIRINTLKINADEFSAIAQQKNWQLTPIPWCAEGFWVSPMDKQHPMDSLGLSVEHLQGLFYIQEASSMLPPVALASLIQSPQQLLDMAAAPGSKTTQMAAHFDPSINLVANELSSSRLKVLHANVVRCGATNVALSHLDGREFGDKSPGLFDAILLDAPCGGEGTVRKDPDALKNWSPEALRDIASTQKQLISSAYQALKPGGVLVYSTCTLSEEENQHICQHLLTQHSDMNAISLAQLFPEAGKCVTSEGYLHVFPHLFDSEGFFVAAFKKDDNASSYIEYSVKPPKRWPFDPIGKKQYSEISDYFDQQFGFNLESLKQQLWLRDNAVWYLPQGSLTVANQFRIDRAGIKIAELHKNRIKTQHEFIMAFGGQITLNSQALTHQQAVDYYRGKDIHLDQTNAASNAFGNSLSGKGECMITYHNQPLGLCKQVSGRLKNSLPRPLVQDNAE